MLFILSQVSADMMNMGVLLADCISKCPSVTNRSEIWDVANVNDAESYVFFRFVVSSDKLSTWSAGEAMDRFKIQDIIPDADKQTRESIVGQIYMAGNLFQLTIRRRENIGTFAFGRRNSSFT
jgi:hypothetical protein